MEYDVFGLLFRFDFLPLSVTVVSCERRSSTLDRSEKTTLFEGLGSRELVREDCLMADLAGFLNQEAIGAEATLAGRYDVNEVAFDCSSEVEE